MAHTATPAARPDPRTERASPTVLAVVVARDGAPWLKRCLASLGRQTYPRLGVIAVDNGSRDGSGDILAGSLGEERVIRLDRAIGFPEAITRAVRRFSAKPPDYLLILHDDVALAPEAVTHMVRAALRAGAGVVGPKVLDARRPRVLREVGLATDRFSYPYSPLDEDEIDQGQYDSPREVLFVSSAAMLVSRDAWMTTGLFDERLETCHGDLDFCWRVRLAGLPVVVDPRAVVTHRGAATNGERPSWRHAHGRFLGEQARLLALLKNYRLRTLAWLLPLALAQGMASVVGLVVSRRFDEAGQVLAAWGWNVVHLPGTVRRRVRARRARRVGDRAVVRYMAPASARIRRWILQATAPLVATAGPQGLDAAGPRPTLRRRVGRALAANPVAVGWGVALVVSLFAFRHVLFGPMPEGGALPVAPPRAMDLLREFGSGWRSAGFGGPGGASPALVPLGLASFITLGRPDLLLRLVLSAALVLAGISSYRAAMRLTADRLGSVTTAACYTLSGVVMWAISDGRIGAIVFLVAAPWLWARVVEGFGPAPPAPLPWVVGTGIGLALSTSFFPATWVAVAAVACGAFVLPPRGGSRVRGILMIGGVVVTAAVLIFPFAVTLAAAGGGAGADAAGQPSFAAMLRLAPGRAPGTWAVALFLPIAATLALAVADDRRSAWRAAALGAATIPLAWLAAAGVLPAAIANPVAFLAVAAASLAMLVGSAVGGLTTDVRGRAFGHRQVAFGVLVLVIGAGLFLQALAAAGGGWAVGRRRIPAAWPVVAASAQGPAFRVLWLGSSGGAAFPPPGGAPDGVVATPDLAVRYGVTSSSGRRLASLAVPPVGHGYRHLEAALGAILDGRVRHGGSILGAMGIRYVVAGSGDLDRPVVRTLRSQADLALIQREGGLQIYHVAAPRPVGWRSAGPVPEARSRDLTAAARLEGEVQPLRSVAPDAWRASPGSGGPGVAVLAVDHDPRWRLDGSPAAPFAAFGWGVGFETSAAEPATMRFTGQGERRLHLVVLAMLWGAALWVTRRRAG